MAFYRCMVEANGGFANDPTAYLNDAQGPALILCGFE